MYQPTYDSDPETEQKQKKWNKKYESVRTKTENMYQYKLRINQLQDNNFSRQIKDSLHAQTLQTWRKELHAKN